jgi:DNA topoisomerase-1
MTSTSPELTNHDPEEAAHDAGLRHVTDERPGISRERKGDGWIYRKPDGTSITSQQTIDRINAIVIPPAWTDVWICTDPRGHIQATGRDDRGRKQYRYHPRWRATRDETKFDRMVEFGEVLPLIREQVEHDLAKQGLPREKVLATVVRLLELTLIRIGTEEYVKANKSYGLTTFRNRHAEVDGSTVHFAFRGKSGIKHAIDVRDRKMANIVKKMHDLPGYHLFQYLDEDGELQEVDAEDVNDYLRAIAGNGFSAKDFRTWAGTVMCAVMLRDCCGWESESEAKKHVVEAVKQVAASLGNTPAVCRKSYIHPAVIEAYYDDPALTAVWDRTREAIIAEHGSLDRDEAAVLRLLRERHQLAVESQTAHIAAPKR